MATKRRRQAEIEELPKPQEALTEEEAAGVQAGNDSKGGTYIAISMGVATVGPTRPPETTSK